MHLPHKQDRLRDEKECEGRGKSPHRRDEEGAPHFGARRTPPRMHTHPRGSGRGKRSDTPHTHPRGCGLGETMGVAAQCISGRVPGQGDAPAEAMCEKEEPGKEDGGRGTGQSLTSAAFPCEGTARLTFWEACEIVAAQM